VQIVPVLKACDAWALKHPIYYGILLFVAYFVLAFLVARGLRLRILIVMPLILAVGQALYMYARRYGLNRSNRPPGD
jgi:hypothetical protein